jgi:hypothetical protein
LRYASSTVIFCRAKWEEGTGRELTFSVENLEINRLALGLFASAHMDGGGIEFDDESDLLEAAIMVSANALHREVFACLRKANGGDAGLYQRLSRTAFDEDDDEEFDPRDLVLNSSNLAAYEFIENGGQD